MWAVNMENMIMNRVSNKRKIGIIATSIVLILVIIVAGCAIYLSDYYHADVDAMANIASSANIEYRTLDDGNIVFEPDNATKGLIFYPGGKVEYTAYIPLMQACAEQDILCVLVEMPFNLAVLDLNAADGIPNQYPQIKEWYIGGHSLGGSMAASYLADHTDAYEGLILLGSYSTADLSDADVDVLSVYGSEDKVMNRENYDENRSNLPDDFEENIIDGGCHAYFGMYGEQEGDGKPTISCYEQIRETAMAIGALMNR